MLVPHGAEDAEFGEGRLAPDDAQHAFVFVGLQPMRGDQLGVIAGSDGMIDVPDLDAALRYAALVPSAAFGTVEVRPVVANTVV
jgi:hypothetical protein